MQWKEIIIGAVSTLLVTVLGGVGVFYWTKEPDSKKGELLFYSKNQAATFKGGTTNVGFNVVAVANEGGLPAKEVVVSIKYPVASISDYSIESQAGIKPIKQQIDKQHAEFVFEGLVPAERLSISILTTAPDEPVVSVRSNSSLGKPIEERALNESGKKPYAEFSEKLVPLTGLLSVILITPTLFVFRRYFRRIGNSKNNVAFLLMHQGLTKYAEEILVKAINMGEDGEFTLANLAVCRAAAGDFPEAASLIKAARFYAASPHALAVISFNEALILLFENKTDDFFAKLNEAVEKSPRQIKRYCEFSTLLASIKNDGRYLAIKEKK